MTTGPIVIKHLAQEFKLDADRLRQTLRKQFGKHKRWRWESNEDPELLKIRQFLASSRITTKTKKPPSQPSKVTVSLPSHMTTVKARRTVH